MTATQMTGVTSTRVSRADRMAMPLAREVVRDLAVEYGACIRPVQLRRRNLDTGEVDQVLVPCGHTLDSVCPACAERAKTLRAAQCREGWHLEDEPELTPDPATEEQRWWITMRAEAQRDRDQAEATGQDTTDFDELITELDDEITKAGVRGTAAPARPARRHRSTRRRQDAPDLPRRKISSRTVGKTYTAPDGKTFRPSLFVTLTCPGYGRVGQDGAPADPESYDYGRAARDALHFAALFDRFIQNLMGRYLGYDVQYFAAVEPQKRLAPHVHIAMRGTVARAELRRVLAATYHQVWWPDISAVRFCCKGKAHDADHLGYAGRRVLVSRKWSGKTLADHRADRRNWLLSTLGVSATDPARYAWEAVAPGDPDHMEHARRLMHAVADRARWQAALNEARRRAASGGHDPVSAVAA